MRVEFWLLLFPVERSTVTGCVFTGALGTLFEGRILVAIVSSGEVYCSRVCALLVL